MIVAFTTEVSGEPGAGHPKPNVVPEFVQMLLRSKTAREMLIGLTTGTSNRTRLETGQQLLTLRIPPLPNEREQEARAALIREAYALRREAGDRLRTAHDAAEATWARPEHPEEPDPRRLPVVDAELV